MQQIENLQQSDLLVVRTQKQEGGHGTRKMSDDSTVGTLADEPIKGSLVETMSERVCELAK